LTDIDVNGLIKDFASQSARRNRLLWIFEYFFFYILQNLLCINAIYIEWKRFFFFMFGLRPIKYQERDCLKGMHYMIIFSLYFFFNFTWMTKSYHTRVSSPLKFTYINVKSWNQIWIKACWC
jgi:hypothetical protein